MHSKQSTTAYSILLGKIKICRSMYRKIVGRVRGKIATNYYNWIENWRWEIEIIDSGLELLPFLEMTVPWPWIVWWIIQLIKWNFTAK